MKTRRTRSIWESPKIKRLLLQPLCTPVALTLAEARAIVREGVGISPQLPEGAEYVRALRSRLGKSLTLRQTPRSG